MTENEQNNRLGQVLERLSATPHDEEAWTELYKLVWPLVIAICYRALKGVSELAEDAAQEVFVRLFRYAPFSNLTEPRRFRSYLWTTARNVSRTYARRLQSERNTEDPEYDDLALALMSNEALPSQKLESRELLEKMLSNLGESDRQLVGYLLEGRP